MSPTASRVVEAVAIIQGLNVEAAAFQAKALAQKALAEVAQQRQMGLMAADALKLVAVYEDVVARLYSLVDNILTRGSGATASSTSTPVATTSQLQQWCDKVSPQAAHLCRRCLDVQAKPEDRYAAMSSLLREIHSSLEHFKPHNVVDELRRLYSDITDKLPDLMACSDALKKAETAWREIVSVDVKRSDWFKKLDAHIDGLVRLRATLEKRVESNNVPQLVDEYEKLVDVVVANLTSASWPGGVVQGMGEAVIKELRRLRGDAVIARILQHPH